MADYTIEQVKEAAKKVMDLFETFEWSDLVKVVPIVMEIVEQVEGMTGAEKQATAVKIIDYVIDETNVPWLPDAFVDPILKKVVPAIIELVISASKGGVAVNER